MKVRYTVDKMLHLLINTTFYFMAVVEMCMETLPSLITGLERQKQVGCFFFVLCFHLVVNN